jgi:trimeric autotransporter adhesin
MHVKTGVTVLAVVILAALGLSAYTVAIYLPSMNNTPGSSNSVGGPGTGTVNFYLTDAPPAQQTLKALLANVTSVTLRYASSGAASTTTSTSGSSTNTSTSVSSTTTNTGPANQTGSAFVFDVPPNVGTNVNITSLSGAGLLLGSANAPAGNVTEIVFQISGAEAVWSNSSSTQLKVVADGKLMVPLHFTVQQGGSTDLTVDLAPGNIHVSQGNLKVLTPVIHVTVVSRGQSGTTTTSATVTETDTSTSDSSSTSTSTT